MAVETLRTTGAFVLLLTLPAFASRADACACVQSTCLDIAAADAVFEATATSIEVTLPTPSSPRDVAVPGLSRKVTLEDIRPLRGDTATIVYTADSTACGYEFQAGTRYLIVAGRMADGRLSVSRCSLTRPLADAVDLREYVDSLQRSASQSQVWGRVSIPRSWTDFVREMDAIAGSQITVRGPDTRSVVTGPDGRYRLTGLRPGSYTVSADVPVVLAGRASIEPQAFVLDAAPHACAEVNVVASINSRISGEVTDERGNRLSGIFVGLRLADQVNLTRGAAGAGTHTGADGRYEFNDLPPGRYSIGLNTDSGPMPVMPFAPVDARTVDGHALASLDLGGSVAMAPIVAARLTPVVVSGVVQDANGNPLSGVVIAPTMLAEQGRTYRSAPSTSGADGRFELRLWAGQRYRIAAGATTGGILVEFVASGTPLTITVPR